LEQLLQIFKDNVLLGLCGAGLVFWLEWLFKGEQKTPLRWRRTCEPVTILSMIMGLYWVPAQAAGYWAIGSAIVMVAVWLNTGSVSYEAGAGFGRSVKVLPFASRVVGLLAAVWAPLVLPALQWFLHDSLPPTFTAPRVADPLLSPVPGLVACALTTAALAVVTATADWWRGRNPA
jgi:hypothetical protein